MIDSPRLPASPSDRTFSTDALPHEPTLPPTGAPWMMVAQTVWWPSAGASAVVGQEQEPRLALSASMVIEIERVDDEYVASEPQTGMYGEGDTDLDAIRSLLGSLAGLREELRAHGDRLAPELAADLRFLDSILWR